MRSSMRPASPWSRFSPASIRCYMGKVTIKDVAADLGVAISTVSNAYNRPDQLSPKLRTRVFATAEKLGYAGPHPAARGLLHIDVAATEDSDSVGSSGNVDLAVQQG